MSVTISVNGEEMSFDGGLVPDLLAARGLDAGQGGVAVALNGAVVPRSEWEQTEIAPGDKVEIVHIVCGG